ncbi:hypothetical protein KSF_064030 [Reticulibacter mediterranei]|uniref:HTH cro/C1-type domain-containing protein n=1 Tax=Reticulibacter mediterranei TaxID=2778369 RepID=A0A8J3N5G2_9CHLR|nr:helix-turn-helix domain-containing protein [Reticulibacter mediterranei]GHO96355.1 hypothetical protein KSF_064030 [Reticulibacter mediterranei]
MGRKDKSVRVGEGETLRIGQRMRLARQNKKLSLTTLAKQLNYSKSYLSTVENGKGVPPLELVDKYERVLQLRPGILTTGNGIGEPLPEDAHTAVPTLSKEVQILPGDRKGTKEDRGEAPGITSVRGRKQELATLKTWIIDDRCKIVVIYGLGGIGKTTLASLARERFKTEFEYVYWRSLQNAPPAEYILRNAINFLSDHQQEAIPEYLNEQVVKFIQYLQRYRCLIIFDNVESVLKDDERPTHTQINYEAYHALVEYLGTAEHQSCIIFTSRERPREIIPLEGKEQLVKSMQLRGLNLEEAREILESEKAIRGSDEIWEKFIRFYDGNLLALKLVSESIYQLFEGDIETFLKEEKGIVGDVDELLQKQFAQLAQLEQAIMYWLAIEREPTSRRSLLNDIIDVEPKKIYEALSSLLRRSMVEKHEKTGHFFLQPVIAEYMTNKFLEQIYDEINKEQIELLASHALIKAQTDDYIRMNQIHFVLEPLAKRLQNTLGKEQYKKIEHILTLQRTMGSQAHNYVAGNMLNLLIYLRADLSKYDFSSLNIRQAYLQGTALHDVTFAHARFERSIFNDNFGSIFVIAVNADGKQLAAGTTDGEIRLWDLASATPIATLSGHTDWVRSVAFHPDATRHLLVSGGEDQTVRLWDLRTQTCLKVLQGHESRIYSVAFSPDGKIIASGSYDTTIRLWDVETGDCLKVLRGHKSRIYSVAFSPDGKIIASGSYDTTIRLWDVETGGYLKALRGHKDGIRAIAFHPDGSMLASGSEDRTVRLWDSHTGRCRSTLQLHDDRVWTVAFDSSGNVLASGSDDQTLRLWSTATGECLNILEGTGSRVYSVAFSPADTTTLVSGSDRQIIQIWDTKTGVCLKTLRGYGCRIYALAFSPLENTLVSGSEDQSICFWNVGAGKQQNILSGHTHWIWSVAFSADGLRLASGSEDWTIRLWDGTERTYLGMLKGEKSYRVYCVAFHPDGNFLASGSTDQAVKLWDLSHQQCVRMFSGHTNRVRSVAFHPGGHLLASGSDDQTIKLWNAESGKCLATLSGHADKVRSVAFHPGGHLLASGSDDQTIKLWSLTSKICQKTLTGHTSRITSIAFNPQNNILASGSEDGTVRLWDSVTGECFVVFPCGAAVYSVAFNYDGTLLASGSTNGLIDIWEVDRKTHIQKLKSEGPYERMDITGVEGITVSQRATLKALGAVEKQEGESKQQREYDLSGR